MPPSRLRYWSHDTASAMSSPPPTTARASPGGSRIGRPPQWTISRSRKLARLYVYTTLSIEKIIKVLEDDVFKPRKNSAQKTIHKMLDNDPRYIRPDSRLEMDQRIGSLLASSARNRTSHDVLAFTPQCIPVQSYDVDTSATSSSITEGIRNLSIPMRAEDQYNIVSLAYEDDNSRLEVRDIQRRVSDCSTIYARQVSTLLRRFSISSTSDAEDEEQQLEHRPLSGMGSLADSPGPSGDVPGQGMSSTFPNPGYALPGDYLRANKWRCTDISNPDHAAGRCWCSIPRETSSIADSWFLPNGQLSEHGRVVLTNPVAATVFLGDHFGNTPLHLVASLEGYRQVLYGMVFRGANVRATNKGHQTFLHVLNEEWFSDLASPSAPLTQLLALLQESAPGLVYETDLYGCTFFHRAAMIVDSGVLAGLLSQFHPVGASRRDAFGRHPLPLANTQFHYATPQQGNLIPFEENAGSRSAGIGGSRQLETRPPTADEVLARYHERLLHIIYLAYDDPGVEDSEGRNGLHCLAQVIINNQTMNEQAVMAAGRSLKRKVDLTDTVIAPPTISTMATSSGAMSASRSTAEGALLTRLGYLENLVTIHSTHPVPVDINHYDKHGNTVLMAFITHISDDQDDKSKTLVAILETLVHAGARLEARNRRGETALLVAARLGRKAALTTLLENGANVYARDAKGRGILEVVDETCRGARDVALYARLEACRVLLTGRRDWGVVLKPNALMEWKRDTR